MNANLLRVIGWLVTGFGVANPAANAQVEALPVGSAPGIYLDCSGLACDFDHFRQSIPFVEWAREREDADLHVLVTSEQAGAATQYTLRFIGIRALPGLDFRHRFTTQRDDTAAETRDQLTRTLAVTLAGLLATTPAADRFRLIPFDPSQAGAPVPMAPSRDRWNHWVFRIGLNGSADGEESSRSFALSGNLSAIRTTQNWRIEIRGTGNYRESRFELDSATTLTSLTRAYRGSGLLVRSIGRHWSLGARSEASSSTFLNQRLTVRVAPAIEYSVFPYEESTERQARLVYSVGVNGARYDQETIYQKTEEVLLDQTLSLILDLTQPWGSARAELTGTALLDDLAQHFLGLNLTTDWRIFRGLSLNLYGDVARVANQRSLASGGTTDLEVILRRRQLATSFRYAAAVGFSYSFGSRTRGVVNRRLIN